MWRVKVPKNIQEITKFLCRVGFWHEDEETVGQRRLKIFYSIYFSLFSILIAAGVVDIDDKDEKIFSVLNLLIGVVLQMKFMYLIWNKKEILGHFNEVCGYGTGDREYATVHEKSTNFKKYAAIFLSLCYFTLSCILFVGPFVGPERNLIFHYPYPLDWQKSEFSFWAAFMFNITEAAIATIIHSFSVFIWYLIANCCWNYEVLGLKIRKMGEIPLDVSADKRQISKIEKDNLYNRDLVEAITSYNSLKEY